MAPKASTASAFDPEDIGPDDIVVVLCPKNDGDVCWFDVPGTNGLAVWIARVKECTLVDKNKGTYKLLGWFLYNEERDLVGELKERQQAEAIDFEEYALVGVYSYEETFGIDKKNVKDIAKAINRLR